ncbi:unnamed protein product [Coregonus sp. 'balchen']|nr:unnamed protein product [Coregonus sp. 'balchen']
MALVQALSRPSAKALRARWRLSQTLHISALPLGVLSSGLEVELFEMGMWSLGLGALGVAIEASELSSLKTQLEELGVPLVAVHHFYGPLQRKMGGLGFIRLGVWQNFMRAWKAGYQGNMLGEGFVLGGVFVIGAGNQGILLEHREKEFGNKVENEDVLEAAKRIVPVQ